MTARRLLLVVLAAIAAIVVLAPRIDRWLSADACRARHGQWDGATDRCLVSDAPAE